MSISKECADFLRARHESQYGQKLKASHAVEIVAAFFGFKSHAAQLAEASYPISKVEDAVIMVPDVPRIEWRMTRLRGLPSNLPSAIELARTLSAFLIEESWFGGKVWIHESLGNYVVEEYLLENDTFISDELSGEMASTNAYFEEFPEYEQPEVLEGEDQVRVAVTGVLTGNQDLDRPYSGHVIGFGVTVTLYRVAGRTCFMEPDIEVGGALDNGYFGFDEELSAYSAP